MAAKTKIHILEYFMLLAAIIYVYPIFILISNSFKTNADYLKNPYGFPKKVIFDNITTAVKSIRFFESGFNTLIITVCVVLCLVIFSSMTAYAIVKRSDRFTKLIYYVIMGGLLIPFQVYMISLVKLLQQMGIARSPLALILSLVAEGTPLSVFLYSGYLKSIPNDLEEAARIDGCGPYTIFFRVIMPLIRPCVAMIVIFFSLRTWNAFVEPLVIIGNTKFKMLIIQINNFMSQPYSMKWNLIFAACMLAMLPIMMLFIIMQDKIISGMTSGAVKG